MGTSVDLSSLSIWLRDFYNKSDDPTDPAGYANFFVEDGAFILGHTKFKGREGANPNSKVCSHSEIAQRKKESWVPLKATRHHLTGTYHKDDRDFMLIGTVDIDLKNGKTVQLEWSGRMYLTEDRKISFYQVYADSSPVEQALKG